MEKAEKDARENRLEKLWCKSKVTAKEFNRSHGYKVLEQTFHELGEEEMKVFKMGKKL